MSEIKIPDTVNQNVDEYENSRKERGFKTIFVYIIVLLLVFSVCSLYAVFQMVNSKSITITLNSDSVSAGKNPDGTAFDIYQILSNEVLEAASEKLDGIISAAELKGHLSVSDALSVKANQQLKQSILDGEHQNTYFPTVYRVTYSILTEELGFKGIVQQFKSIIRLSKDQILEAVAESYQEFYEVTYLTYDKMFEIDWENIDTMDYYNRSEALHVETMRILRFLQDKANENPVNGSSSVKLTYGDLSNDLWQLINVDIENYQAYIIQNNITKSRTELLRQFRYMEELYKEEMERKTEEYLILDDAVDMYDATTTKVVFIPALDQEDAFYMNRTKVGLDYLVESADSARLAADEAEHNAQYYQYLQTCFADTVTPTQGQISHADSVYLNIKNQIDEMAESVKVLLAESNQTENEGIKISNTTMTVGIVGIGMSFAKRFVILSMAAYVLICVLSVFRRKKYTDFQEV